MSEDDKNELSNVPTINIKKPTPNMANTTTSNVKEEINFVAKHFN